VNENAPPKRSFVLTIILVVAGLIFSVVWIYAHIVWATMSAMASMMANDSGKSSMGAWGGLIGGMLMGQVIAGSAGIPGGLAFFWRGRRRLLILLFLILFIVGALCQVWSFHNFFSDAAVK